MAEAILTPEAVAVTGLFCGVCARAFLPYLRKTIKENIKLEWQHKYTAILIVSLIVTILVYPSFQVPTDGLTVFIGAFIFGFGLDSAATEIYEWLRKPKT